jgi:hypothetical protein
MELSADYTDSAEEMDSHKKAQKNQNGIGRNGE